MPTAGGLYGSYLSSTNDTHNLRITFSATIMLTLKKCYLPTFFTANHGPESKQWLQIQINSKAFNPVMWFILGWSELSPRPLVQTKQPNSGPFEKGGLGRLASELSSSPLVRTLSTPITGSVVLQVISFVINWRRSFF